MTTRSIINPKLSRLMAAGADPTKAYGLDNGAGLDFQRFDLVPAGAGQVSALIKKIKPFKDIIAEMVS